MSYIFNEKSKKLYGFLKELKDYGFKDMGK
jgi:hypothetical protein